MFSMRPGFTQSPNQGSGQGQYPEVDLKTVNGFIFQKAVSIKYWKSTQCPCFTPETGQPNMACPKCRGLGFTYFDLEQEPKFQRAMVHSRRSTKQNDKGGILTTGYSSATFMPGVIPGDGDLVQVCADREVVNDEYHVLGETLLDGTSGETLRFRDVACIEHVLVRDSITKEITKVDNSLWIFSKEKHRIEFPTNPFTTGTQYSIRYVAVPEYIVLGQSAKPLLRVAHDDGLPSPQRENLDIVYPFNVQMVRLDRAIAQRLRGKLDNEEPTTFNNNTPRGPFV